MTMRHFGRYRFEASNEQKVMFPDAGVTKGELIDYYDRIAEFMLPHIKQRPLSMQRFPDGIDGSGFYEKKLPEHFPDWVDHAEVPTGKQGGVQKQAVANNRATLAYLANQACITPHAWLSRVDALNQPDRMIFDLDPSDDAGFEVVRDAAMKLRALTDDLDIATFVMTTGSRGVHVVIPLQGGRDFDDVRALARKLADRLARRHPEQLTTQVRKHKREGRLFLDTARNAYGQTAVPPYAVRARSGAPVAAPITWDELDDRRTHAQRFTMANIFRRLGQVEDRWSRMHRHRRTLESIEQAVDRLEPRQADEPT